MSPLQWWMAIRVLDIRVIDFVGIVTPVLVNAALMMFAMEVAKRALSTAGGATRLIVVFAVGVVVYGTASFILHGRWKNRGLRVAMAQLAVPRRTNGETSPSMR